MKTIGVSLLRLMHDVAGERKRPGGWANYDLLVGAGYVPVAADATTEWTQTGARVGLLDQHLMTNGAGYTVHAPRLGALVFEADTSMKMLLHHLNTPPVPPSQRTELPVPKELDELVLACLQKDPARRPQNAGELFRMAYNCRACEGWNADAAEAWWQAHLPELTGPLTTTGERTPTAAAL